MQLTIRYVLILFIYFIALASNSQEHHEPAYWNWAAAPPMGWNSYDAYGDSVTEAEVLANAKYMKDHLLRYGWNYMVVDYRWYDPGANSTDLSKRVGAQLTADVYGRLLPSPNRFPSAAKGQGFKPLADKLHAMGLKFGIHIMRGIARQSVRANTPIEGSQFKAMDAANTQSICDWNPDMFGIDASKLAGQAWYDSIFRQYAHWGVDFIKVDDLSEHYATLEVEAIRKAIDRSGRQIVFSTSPGETPIAAAGHVKNHANMWRISSDFWDSWGNLKHNFHLLALWQPYLGPGHWPDADMIPLGVVCKRNPSVCAEHSTRFTQDEQYTLMSLWSIARSPLMFGGNLPQLDDFTKSLVTNDEIIAVNQHSNNNRVLFDRGGLIAWVAKVPGSPDSYLALFNTLDGDPALNNSVGVPSLAGIPYTCQEIPKVAVQLSELGCNKSCVIRDLWQKRTIGEFAGEFAPHISWHGAGLYRLIAKQ